MGVKKSDKYEVCDNGASAIYDFVTDKPLNKAILGVGQSEKSKNKFSKGKICHTSWSSFVLNMKVIFFKGVL